MPKPARYVEDVAQAMSIKYNNRVYEMKAAGVDVTVLSLGEAFFDIPLYPFDDLPFPDIYHYSHSRGILPLRERLAAYYRDEYGVPVDPASEILVTAGSKAAIHMALMAMLNPGDEAIIHEPAWVSYPEQVRLCHAQPRMVPYDVPVTALGEHVTEKTRVIILNNPHNPRGEVLSREQLQAVVDVAREHDIYVISDEAYSDFLLEEDEFVSLGVLDPDKTHSVICNSMSKNYGMSGWRIGYVVTNPEMTDQILKVNQHLITCPATILEWYLTKHFDDVLEVTKPQIRGVVEQRRELAGFMDGIGLEYLPGTATFYFFVSIAPSKLGSEEFCDRLLADEHICVVPGIGYGESCDAFVRVSVGTEPVARIQDALRTLKALIEATSA